MADETAARTDVSTLSMRLFNAGRRIARQYAQDAQKEAARDARRLAMGVGFCVFAAVFALHAIIFLHAFVVTLLDRFVEVLELWQVLGIVLAADLGIALTAVLIGVMLLRQPVLPRTRATLLEFQALLAPVASDEQLDG